MPYSEDDLLPISALQHMLYCERQCALIHLERLWAENRYTVEGNLLHKKAHSGRGETRPAARTTRGLPVRSLEIGLFGVADVVRYEQDGAASMVPVEYKRGRPKKNDCDRVQLCAQALCLEEMHGVHLERGEIFYGSTRRRVGVEFTGELRQTTIATASRLRSMLRAGKTPPAEPGPKCDRCSLRELCLPKLGSRGLRTRDRFDRDVEALLRDMPSMN